MSAASENTPAHAPAPTTGVEVANARLIDTSGLETALYAFADARDWHRHHTPKNLAMALSVEVAELVEIFQWHTDAEAKAVMQTNEARHVEQELADIAMYLVRLSSVLGVDLNRAVCEKLVMNARKYPAPPA